MLDPVREALATLAQRLGRTLLTSVASALGVGVLVLSVGLTDTLERQISDEFDALRATEVVVRPEVGGPNLASDAEERVKQIEGVSNAGTIVRLGPSLISRTTADTGEPSVSIDVLAVTPAALDVLGVRLSSGRLFDSFHAVRSHNVAVLGEGAARRLGFDSPDGIAAVMLNGQPHVVVGVAEEVTRRPAFTGMAFVPLTAKPRIASESNLEEILIETAPGAAAVVAAQSAMAISPSAPESFAVSAPPDPATFREGIETALRSSLLALGIVILIIGLLGIANSTFVSVLERTREIGIRRALGARPLHISVQILTESGMTGGIGGLIGMSMAVIALVVLCAVNEWTPTFRTALVPIGPILGLLVGCLAGIPPARRATRVEPTEALRH